jgi:hypothetical protein
MTAEVVLDPAGIPALLSEALDVPRGEAILGADLPERLRSRFALLENRVALSAACGKPCQGL